MIRDGHVSTSLSSRTPSGADLCRPYACCLSLCEFRCEPALLCLESFSSLESSIHSLNSEVRNLMETSVLGLSEEAEYFNFQFQTKKARFRNTVATDSAEF